MMLWMDYLGKMFAVVILMSGIYTTAGFNIFTKPVHNFTNGDKLFGQTIIKSRNGVFVPSPSSGKIFSCTLESDCSVVRDEFKKGQRPITSVSSSLNDENEQLLICNQVRAIKASTEDLNGYCSKYVLNQQTLEEFNPASLVLEQQKHNVSVNSNTGCPQAHSRKKRQADPNAEVENEDDENPGTEIAFVLDGSGSISSNDFEKAKDFIYNVMKNVWESCFTCNFAIVQFGTKIRTELSLLENSTEEAFKKVKSIEQVGNYTKTADALYHVLTEVFVPANGSNVDAKKFIILLSDGELLGKQRNLTDVLAMPEMNGISRFAIGVGVMDNKKAIEEMKQIAGAEERFFSVASYTALQTILSCLEKSIIWFEGIQKGAGFQLQLAEAGFSSHLTHDGTMLFGAVGAYDWSGGVILKNSEKTVKFLNATKEEPRFSYLGYSVASARMGTKTLYLSGAPRYNLTGAVFIFDGTNQDVIEGDQVGSYFGSVLCTLDIDNNQKTDYLLVGAPHFHEKGEEGYVLVYKLHQGKFEREDYVLRGMGKHIYARFGSAIAAIGDIDGDKYTDLAVGAPLEASGSIYIFNGCEKGIKEQFSQRISPSNFGVTRLVHFGQAVSAMSDSKQDKEHFIAVGSEGVVTVFKTVPVIVINPKMDVDRTEISLDEQFNDESKKIKIKLTVCFNEQRKPIASGEQLFIDYKIDLDSGQENKRLFDAKNLEKSTFLLSKDQNCIEPRELEYWGCNDCFSPIRIKLDIVTLVLPSDGVPVRVLDAFSPKEFIREIQFEKECKDGKNCIANISLAHSKLSTDLITIGSSESLSISFDLTNSGESSYMTTLTVTYPKILQTKKIDGGVECEVKDKDHQIVCKLLHPVFKRNAQTSVNIMWGPTDMKSDLSTASIDAVLTGGNNGTEVLDHKTYVFGVKNSLILQIISTPSPIRLTKDEETKIRPKNLDFSFKMMGENKYKAKINVTITIVNKTHSTEVSIKSVEPKNCVWHWDQAESNYRIDCSMTDLQDIVIMTDTLIHDVQGTAETITATAQLSFDETIYDGNYVWKTSKAEVTVDKLTVVKSTAPIIGGSIGGFILLFIIIIVLIKCGFFRRRHQVERPQ